MNNLGRYHWKRNGVLPVLLLELIEKFGMPTVDLFASKGNKNAINIILGLKIQGQLW